jgi:hypothetical protein
MIFCAIVLYGFDGRLLRRHLDDLDCHACRFLSVRIDRLGNATEAAFQDHHRSREARALVAGLQQLDNCAHCVRAGIARERLNVGADLGPSLGVARVPLDERFKVSRACH